MYGSGGGITSVLFIPLFICSQIFFMPSSFSLFSSIAFSVTISSSPSKNQVSYHLLHVISHLSIRFFIDFDTILRQWICIFVNLSLRICTSGAPFHVYCWFLRCNLLLEAMITFQFEVIYIYIFMFPYLRIWMECVSAIYLGFFWLLRHVEGKIKHEADGELVISLQTHFTSLTVITLTILG